MSKSVRTASPDPSCPGDSWVAGAGSPASPPGAVPCVLPGTAYARIDTGARDGRARGVPPRRADAEGDARRAPSRRHLFRVQHKRHVDLLDLVELEPVAQLEVGLGHVRVVPLAVGQDPP